MYELAERARVQKEGRTRVSNKETEALGQDSDNYSCVTVPWYEYSMDYSCVTVQLYIHSMYLRSTFYIQ